MADTSLTSMPMNTVRACSGSLCTVTFRESPTA